MSRAGITYHDVAKAAGKLSAEGKNPTVDNVRAALGDTGSRGTIAPLLKRWKEESQGRGGQQAALRLPPELVEAVQALHDRLQASVQIKLDEQEAAHQQAEQVWRAETALLVKELADAKASIKKLSTELDQAQIELSARHGLLQVTNMNMVALKAENTGVTQRLMDQQSANEDMSRQLRETREQMTHYQEAVSRQRAEERHVAEQRQALLEQELATARRQLRDSETQQVQTQAEASQLQSSLTQLRDDLLAAQKAAAETQQLSDQRSYRLTDLEQAHKSLTEAHSVAQAALSQARTELAVAEAEKRLQSDLITRMDNEKAGLKSQLQNSQQDKSAMERQLQQLQAALATIKSGK